jgi:hypothetical protein
MILINYAHPLTPAQLAQVEALTRQGVEQLVELRCQIDPQQPLLPQVTALVEAAGLSPEQWQTAPLLINPPSLNYIAVALVAELHGRCGYFPAMLRLRPVPESAPPQFEVAEVLNLQGVRDAARCRR